MNADRGSGHGRYNLVRLLFDTLTDLLNDRSFTLDLDFKADKPFFGKLVLGPTHPVMRFDRVHTVL